jgi:glutathione S-transferase
MMKLRHSPTSPFARKVRMAVDRLGLADRIELVLADTSDPADSLRQQNPLGKLPALILESGEAIFDSAVITQYLDAIAGGGKILPLEPTARFAALTREALADGICEAAILQVYEQRMREPHERSAKWLAYQAGKVARALAALEADPPAGDDETIGAIALAAALGYLDLRFEGKWRANHPRLVAWLEGFGARWPIFEATRFRS